MNALTKRLVAMVGATLLVCSATALAQPRTGGSGSGGGAQLGGGGGGRDRGPSGPDQPGKIEDKASNQKATIQKYRASKEGGDSLGTLDIRLESGKSLKLDVREKDNVKIELNAHAFSAEDYDKVMLPGLMVTVGWDTTKKGSRSIKYLTTFQFETIRVEGRIVGPDPSSPDVLKIKAKPVNDQEWPNARKPAAPRNPPPSRNGGRTPPPAPSTPKQKTIPEKPLKLKFIENVSQIAEGSNTVSLTDLQRDQEIAVDIVFSQKMSLMVKADVKGATESSEGEASAGKDKEGSGGGRG